MDYVLELLEILLVDTSSGEQEQRCTCVLHFVSLVNKYPRNPTMELYDVM